MEHKQDGKLSSWKEIAAYLGCEERTARRWEKERALPVHRPPGKRSHVYAFREELKDWLTRQPPNERAAAPRFSRRAVLAGLGGSVLALGAGAAWLLRGRAGNPVRATIAGNTLQAWDERGRLLWEHSLRSPCAI